jgi:nucleoside-diphosphate-sugar epimerase
VTKAAAEREVLAANSPSLRTVALRPHLITGAGDPHLVPRLVAASRANSLWIVGRGKNRVDITHVENVVDAHLLAEAALGGGTRAAGAPGDGRDCAGRAYFITNGEPVVLWEWINGLLVAMGERPATRRISLATANAAGLACEIVWRILPLRSEPPLTRFVAAELAKDHWFDIAAARRDLGYSPRVSLAQLTEEIGNRYDLSS